MKFPLRFPVQIYFNPYSFALSFITKYVERITSNQVEMCINFSVDGCIAQISQSPNQIFIIRNDVQSEFLSIYILDSDKKNLVERTHMNYIQDVLLDLAPPAIENSGEEQVREWARKILNKK